MNRLQLEGLLINLCRYPTQGIQLIQQILIIIVLLDTKLINFPLIVSSPLDRHWFPSILVKVSRESIWRDGDLPIRSSFVPLYTQVSSTSKMIFFVFKFLSFNV